MKTGLWSPHSVFRDS